MPSDISAELSPLPSSLADLTGVGRQAFLQSLSQHARLLSIDTPLPAAALLVEKFTGHEAMSELFHFDIDCVATSAHFELKELTNQEVTLRILLANGSTRAFHGIVTSAMQLGSDGSLTRYRLSLAPWMIRLTQRRDNYVFQDKSVLDIVEEVLKDYPFANCRFDVKTVLPKRSVTMQYRESDYDFITRLLAEEGLNFYFTHGDDHADPAALPSRSVPNTPESKSGQAKHQFIVFDDNESLAVGADASIRFHRAAPTESSDTITHFAQRHQVQSNSVAMSAWDYKKLVSTSSEDSVATKPDDVPTLEVYEGAGAYRYTDDAESARIAKARVESLVLTQQVIQAESSVRALAVGTWFTLTNYGDDLLGMMSNAANGNTDPHQYAVLSIEHSGANNLFPGMATLAKHGKQHDMEAGTYRNRFTCAPRSVPIRPVYWRPKPTAPGAHIAVVVGVRGEEITTERDHRVKVQFPWQRGDAAVSGQALHPSTSNAPGNETAGTWVRVMEPAAGSNWGGNFIPRIGQEVQVDFINGDIDRPIIIGQVYNGSDTPPFHGGDNHPGALTGFQSKEYAGSGYNQWVIDDTPNQLRQTLATTTAASQFNVGYLIRQDGNQRNTYRGSGLELTTDAWSILRAKRGLFVTTAPRGGATSTQLDTTEAQGKLKAAGDLSKALSDASVQHQASSLSMSQGLEQLSKTISDKQEADGQNAHAFTSPIALIDSEAGISVTTPATAATFAGQDLTMTAHGGMRVTGGEAVSIAAGKTVSLFTHEGGAKVIAGNSPVSFQAHTGAMDVIADQAMTITSSNGSIKIMAKDEILLASGGGYIKLAGANIDIACPSSVSVKGASHDFMGAASGSVALSTLPDTRVQLFDEAFILKDQETGELLINHPYRIKRADGTYEYGKTDDKGHTHTVNAMDSEKITLEVL
ncbi:MAG TPA: type VI secretion system Vgr family protein [Burkholderiaceae bacterium]|jgi:type VI secretion system secreted protein VgrG